MNEKIKDASMTIAIVNDEIASEEWYTYG